MRATLRYTDCLQDGRQVFYVLAKRNVKILKTKQKDVAIHPEVTIYIKSNEELNQLLSNLNYNCRYEVSVVKVYPYDNFFDFIKNIFKTQNNKG